MNSTSQLNICSLVTNCIKSGAHDVNHESRHLISNVNHYSSVIVRYQAIDYYIVVHPALYDALLVTGSYFFSMHIAGSISLHLRVTIPSNYYDKLFCSMAFCLL